MRGSLTAIRTRAPQLGGKVLVLSHDVHEVLALYINKDKDIT